MLVKQVSVFLENTKGRVYEISKTLADNNINLIGISIADTTDFGILRIFVSNPEETLKVLKENNYTAKLTDVVAFEIKDAPGGMALAFKALSEGNISVEYLYAVTKSSDGNATIVVKSDDLMGAINALKENDIKILTKEEFYSL